MTDSVLKGLRNHYLGKRVWGFSGAAVSQPLLDQRFRGMCRLNISMSVCLSVAVRSLSPLIRSSGSIVSGDISRRNIGFPRGLHPGSRHAMATIITGPTFMGQI